MIKMSGLTERQYEVYVWIKKFINKHGWSPSNKQIGEEFGIASSTANEITNRIVHRGFLVKTKGSSRGLGLPE